MPGGAEPLAPAEAMVEEVALPLTGSVFGKEPPDRNDGHSDRSSGNDDGDLPMYERMAAA